MKPMGESKDVFMAYAAIDYGYFAVRKIQEQMSKPMSNIDMMIDQATGFNKFNFYKKELIEIMEDIIKNKKIVEADFLEDEKILSGIKKLTYDPN